MHPLRPAQGARSGAVGYAWSADLQSRMTYSKRAAIGLAIAVGGSVPLLLYMMFGPKDGNPIGLGLLMLLSWLIGAALIIWSIFGRRHHQDS